MKTHQMKVAPCPTCNELVSATEWTRNPEETTFTDIENIPSWRTFKPGPEADLKLTCGHEVHGKEGVEFLQVLAAS